MNPRFWIQSHVICNFFHAAEKLGGFPKRPQGLCVVHTGSAGLFHTLCEVSSARFAGDDIASVGNLVIRTGADEGKLGYVGADCVEWQISQFTFQRKLISVCDGDGSRWYGYNDVIQWFCQLLYSHVGHIQTVRLWRHNVPVILRVNCLFFRRFRPGLKEFRWTNGSWSFVRWTGREIFDWSRISIVSFCLEFTCCIFWPFRNYFLTGKKGELTWIWLLFKLWVILNPGSFHFFCLLIALLVRGTCSAVSDRFPGVQTRLLQSFSHSFRVPVALEKPYRVIGAASFWGQHFLALLFRGQGCLFVQNQSQKLVFGPSDAPNGHTVQRVRE